MAMLIGRTYSVVTTLSARCQRSRTACASAGLSDRCASVRANGMSTLEVDNDPAGAIRSIVEEARKAVEARPGRGDLPRLRRHGRAGGGDHL